MKQIFADLLNLLTLLMKKIYNIIGQQQSLNHIPEKKTKFSFEKIVIQFEVSYKFDFG